ncbi:hypothetical protein GLAREA_06751 [Glarea lozoyensis ATCC 20868]|uniref:Uncharacterized protein n=1 Tax=Glarea lozoyensis (strain ATCC 20868 / MF5171) TaxID=1116229 RepID=S3E5U0_GLAL2|nr:uncharacterized protein GLAREA_06751 [Glarea lozoyensis ATCC 20868]EPE33738.1 hypothetical protein GLAREA_06751 [Glarea lozoyensis ATCC 20868]
MTFFGGNNITLTAHWEPEPNKRGTFSILSTCLFTMLLCVAYTAFRQYQDAKALTKHMRAKFDQPLPKSTVARCTAAVKSAISAASKSPAKLVRCFKVLLITSKQQPEGITNPGDIVHPHKEPKARVRHAWTMIHSHFALMGGIAIDTRTAPTSFLPRGITRTIITYDGLIFLADKDPALVPDISRAQILDKSKASGFAKALVCFQALWFSTQVITRLAQGLSICILELHTFAHALCTLLIYCFWWDKPLDVSEPSLVVGSETHGIAAIMALFWDFNASSRKLGTDTWAKFELDPYCFDPHKTTVELQELGMGVLGCRRAPTMDHQALLTPHTLTTEQRIRMWPGQSIHGFCFCGYWPRIKFDRHFFDSYNVVYSSDNYVDIFPSDLECMRLALPALQKYDMIQYDQCKWDHYAADGTRVSHYIPTIRWEYGEYMWGGMGMVRDRVENIGGYAGHLNTSFDRLFMVFSLASLSYGGLHLMAWNAPLASNVQRILWRISAASLAGPAGLYFAYMLTRASKLRIPASRVYHDTFDPPRYKIFAKLGNLRDAAYFADHKFAATWIGHIRTAIEYVLDMPRLAFGSILLAAGALSLLWLFARVFIIVECFINLAFLPESAYDTPNWSRYAPHFT